MKSDVRDLLYANVRAVPNFPKEGVMFRDFFPLLEDPHLCRLLLKEMKREAKDLFEGANVLAGLDSRGLILAPLLRGKTRRFVPIRKAGKLPPPVLRTEYALEYGTAAFELARGVLKKGDRVLLIDDLLATGGSLIAADKLTKEAGAEVVGALVAIELGNLNGRLRLQEEAHIINVRSVLTYT